jgi:DeoR family transcriptional regulator, fructose operon transcriptional repressor
VTTPSERRDLIETLAIEQGSVFVAELAERFGVTRTSIRRDLRLIEGQGRLERVHGGAVAVSHSLRRGVYPSREHEHLSEKRRIAAAAASLVVAGNVVLFDSGSTVAAAAASIKGGLRVANAVTAVTHSLPVMNEIGSWAGANLICLGGLYLHDYRAFVGPQTLASLRELSADIVFVGCDGLTIEQGITTANVLVAEVGRMMASRARRVVALADSSKLARQGLTSIIPLGDVDLFITDDAADPQMVARIRDVGCEVILV